MDKLTGITLTGSQDIYQPKISAISQKSGSKSEDLTKMQQKKAENVSAPTEKQLIEAVNAGNKELKKLETNLRFSVHEKTQQVMVKIVNADTEEVIREIPSEKILDLVASIMERAGILIDKRG